MNSPMKKNIVIVGTSRGIGWQLTQQLARQHQLLVLSRSAPPLETLENKEAVAFEPIDLTQKQLKQQLTTILKEKFSHVDVLINNAGYLVNRPILETTEEDIDTLYATNVAGLIKTCQAVIPFMKEGGHIVNIGSIGGVQGSVKFPGISVYSSSKAAVAGFTECLAEELKKTGIRVNCLALGAVQTQMLAEAFPRHRNAMPPETMANYIADFALHGHQWFNGKVLPVSLSTP